MKDDRPLNNNDSYYTISQTITDRVSSTYSNVLRVAEGAPGGVAGTYTCNVSNVLGNDSMQVMAVGEFSVSSTACSISSKLPQGSI